MNSTLETVILASALSEGTNWMFDASIKGIWLMGAATVWMLAWRGGLAATRHFIWLTVLTSLLILPLASLFPMAWTGPAWARNGDFMQRWVENIFVSANAPPVLPPILANAGEHRAKPEFVKRDSKEASAAAKVSVARRIDFRGWILLAWGAGVSVFLAGFFFRLVLLRSIEQASRILDDPECLALAEMERAALGLKRAVCLRESADSLMPMTWGWWRPVLLLPAGAARWDRERLRLVLRHELAHVKRWDCLTQGLADLACALHWFNPLVWLAARQMRLERERACDDLVLSTGARPSDYAGHLLEIARQFAHSPRVAAIPMAKPSTLEQRLRALVDANRKHGHLRPATGLTVFVIVVGLVIFVGGCKSTTAPGGSSQSEVLRQQQIARLQSFSAAKEKQSRTLAEREGDRFFPEFQTFFNAATRGDGRTVTNMYENFKKRHGQYENSTGDLPHKSYWSPVLEVALAYYDVMAGEPKYVQLAIEGIIKSVPAGSIYFGATDPGRGLPTAFSRSHVDADPFFTLTQNALADGTYLKYLRETYGGKIYTPTDEDSQKCFAEYVADAGQRLKENKLKPSENVKMVDGKVQVQGQHAVFAINALLTKIIFDKNPNQEFYIEESFPLDWMYPHLSPNGFIMKINRQPLPELSQEMIERDRKFWRERVDGMIGNWLTEETSLQKVTGFVEKIYARNDRSGFNGDPLFIQNKNAQKMFSKWRSSISGVYNWRISKARNPAEKQRMIKEADFAFRQAFALCPYSPEAVFRYVSFLIFQKRRSDALLVAETAVKVDPGNELFQSLVTGVKASPKN